MLQKLKQLKIKRLLTLNEFIDVIKRKRIPKADKYQLIIDYKSFLDRVPVRQDFINFDNEGFFLSENKPMFKGFITCEEASSEEVKVPLKDNVRIYITEKDVVVYADKFITDNCKLNEVAIAFNPENDFERLEFNF